MKSGHNVKGNLSNYSTATNVKRIQAKYSANHVRCTIDQECHDRRPTNNKVIATANTVGRVLITAALCKEAGVFEAADEFAD